MASCQHQLSPINKVSHFRTRYAYFCRRASSKLSILPFSEFLGANLKQKRKRVLPPSSSSSSIGKNWSQRGWEIILWGVVPSSIFHFVFILYYVVICTPWPKGLKLFYSIHCSFYFIPMCSCFLPSLICLISLLVVKCVFMLKESWYLYFKFCWVEGGYQEHCIFEKSTMVLIVIIWQVRTHIWLCEWQEDCRNTVL